MFRVYNRKSEHHHPILLIRIRQGTRFQLKLCGTKFSQKRVFPVENGKRKHHHLVLHIPISIGTNISSLNWQFCFFESNLLKKCISWVKSKKVNISTEFCILELVYVPNFSLNCQFWILGATLPKKSISDG